MFTIHGINNEQQKTSLSQIGKGILRIKHATCDLPEGIIIDRI